MGKTEQEMFKLMEQGKVMAADIMPAVAKEFSRTAREGGALAAAQIKVNSEYQRFLNGLTMIKDEIFKGGFGEGMAMVFKQTSMMMKEMKPLATFLGQTLKTALGFLTSALKIVEMPISLVTSLLGAMPKELAGTLGFIGALTLYTLRFNASMMLLGKSTIGVATLLRALPPVAVAIAAEDIYTTAKNPNADTAINRRAASLGLTGQQLLNKFASAPMRTVVELAWKDGAELFIQAKVEESAKQDIAAESRR